MGLNQQDFEKLAVPLVNPLYNFARWMSADADEAQDLVQETFAKALKGLSSFREGTNFRAWMFRILRNTFLTSRTGLARRQTVQEGEEGLDELAASPDTPELTLLRRADRELVQQGIALLPASYKEVIILADLEEMKYQEIADALDIPIGTVMSRLSRARKQLREHILQALGRTGSEPAERYRVMTCAWAKRVRLFVDDELEPAAQAGVAAHLAGCAECTVAVAEHLALKKLVRTSANRYSAPPELHASLFRQTRPRSQPRWLWTWGVAAASVLLVSALAVSLWHKGAVDDALIAELVDQHVIALSSLNPVDVISEDRHTVKPWFQGRLPFTFNLPELIGSGFTLIGGKVVYLQRNPAAELLYQSGRHKISVFVMQEPAAGRAPGAGSSFNVKSWRDNGLQFFLVTDGNDAEAAKLVTMWREVNRP